MENIENTFRQILSPEEYSELFQTTTPTVTEEEITVTEENKILPIIKTDEEKIDLKTSRFSSAIWFEAVKTKEVAVIGCGGIGSNLVYNLSRLNLAKIRCFDPDKVGEENISGQMYTINDIGKYKVDALRLNIVLFSDNIDLYCYSERFSDIYKLCPITFCCVDNMQTRKIAFYSWLQYTTNTSGVFIDGRLAAEQLQIFCIPAHDEKRIEEYKEKWLFDDAEAEQSICSYKQTTYTATLIGSLMTNLFINYVTNLDCNPLMERDLPFYTEYNAELMFLKQK